MLVFDFMFYKISIWNALENFGIDCARVCGQLLVISKKINFRWVFWALCGPRSILVYSDFGSLQLFFYQNMAAKIFCSRQIFQKCNWPRYPEHLRWRRVQGHRWRILHSINRQRNPGDRPLPLAPILWLVEAIWERIVHLREHEVPEFGTGPEGFGLLHLKHIQKSLVWHHRRQPLDNHWRLIFRSLGCLVSKQISSPHHWLHWLQRSHPRSGGFQGLRWADLHLGQEEWRLLSDCHQGFIGLCGRPSDRGEQGRIQSPIQLRKVDGPVVLVLLVWRTRVPNPVWQQSPLLQLPQEQDPRGAVRRG